MPIETAFSGKRKPKKTAFSDAPSVEDAFSKLAAIRKEGAANADGFKDRAENLRAEIARDITPE